jgi:hypothetical protein
LSGSATLVKLITPAGNGSEVPATQAPLRNFVHGSHTDPRDGAHGYIVDPSTVQALRLRQDLSLYGFEDYTRVKHVMSHIGDQSNDRKAKRSKLKRINIYHPRTIPRLFHRRDAPLRGDSGTSWC